MWQIYHLLFGWDYIAWSNSVDQGIARVHVDGNGNPWYYQYKIINCIKVIKSKDEVIWLTCSSTKYIK